LEVEEPRWVGARRIDQQVVLVLVLELVLVLVLDLV
jgi:hypothetical protein